jgi:hypothetical protein
MLSAKKSNCNWLTQFDTHYAFCDIEPSPRQAAGRVHRKDECLFSVRSLTPPQTAKNALAIAVQGRPACGFRSRHPDQTTISGSLNLPVENQGK